MHRRGHDVEGTHRRRCRTRRYAQALHYNRDALPAGRPRPEQAADDVGAAPAVREADRGADRQGRLRADGPKRQHRPAGSLTTVAYTLGGRMETGRGTSATATLDQPADGLGRCSMLRTRCAGPTTRWARTFDYTLARPSTRRSRPATSACTSAARTSTRTSSRRASIDPSIYGIAPMPLAKHKDAGVIGGGSLAAHPARREGREARRGRQAGSTSSTIRKLVEQGRRDPRRKDPRREQAAGRGAVVADLQQAAVRPGEHVDQVVRQRPDGPDEAVH